MTIISLSRCAVDGKKAGVIEGHPVTPLSDICSHQMWRLIPWRLKVGGGLSDIVGVV